MARLPRLCISGIPQHIIQRGNNKQVCFCADDDFAAYSHWLAEYSVKFNVAIHAWVLMTNHVHLLMTADTDDGISQLMQTLGRLYVRYFNDRYQRTGTLWEGRFKSCVIDAENYFLICQQYIELNPVRARMVDEPGDYHWSSYQANGLGKAIKCWQPHRIYRELGVTLNDCAVAYRELFNGHIDSSMLNKIRKATNQGLVLGNDRFKTEIEQLTGQRVKLLRRGPKPVLIRVRVKTPC